MKREHLPLAILTKAAGSAWAISWSTPLFLGFEPVLAMSGQIQGAGDATGSQRRYENAVGSRPKNGSNTSGFRRLQAADRIFAHTGSPSGDREPFSWTIFRGFGRHNRTREPGHTIVPEIWGKLLTILSARGAEDKRKATGSIFRHRVL
jgi:hypothetical protein